MTARHARTVAFAGILLALAPGVLVHARQALTPAAVAETQARAEQGDADAQYKIGIMYSEGRGVPQNDAVAFAWYRQAAEHGVAEAQFNVGLMYSAGRGVPQDEAEAVIWYLQAAAQGLADAQVNLGVIFAAGQVVASDLVTAYICFSNALDRLTGERRDQVLAARNSVVEEMTNDQITLARKRLGLAGRATSSSNLENILGNVPTRPRDQFELSLPITHRHAFAFRPAMLTLRADSLEFRHTNDDSSHDFVIPAASITQLNMSSNVSRGEDLSYVLHFEESTRAGNRIVFEMSRTSVFDLLSWVETFAPRAVVLM